MGNAALSSIAQASGGLHYRFSRCCICFLSIDRMKFEEESSSDDDEPKPILKCVNDKCARIFHKKCLDQHFESVGTKTCPGCEREIVNGKVVMVTPRDRETTPSR